MKSFSVGEVLASADLNEYCVNTHFAFKNSNTTRTSAPNATNDPDLTLPVEANVIYFMQCELVFNSGATPGFQYSFSVPAGTTLGGTFWARSAGVTSSANLGLLTTLSGFADGGVNDSGVSFMGYVNTGSATGNLVVQWGQETSSATNTVLKTGSCLFLRRVA